MVPSARAVLMSTSKTTKMSRVKMRDLGYYGFQNARDSPSLTKQQHPLRESEYSSTRVSTAP
jgi:hypothetical protein